MEMFETALGRLVPANEVQTLLEDSILSLLYDYRMSPQNPANVPMKLSDIVRAVSPDTSSASEALVLGALDALMENSPPLVKEGPPLKDLDMPGGVPTYSHQRTFSITGSGVRFVRNMPQGIASVR